MMIFDEFDEWLPVWQEEPDGSRRLVNAPPGGEAPAQHRIHFTGRTAGRSLDLGGEAPSLNAWLAEVVAAHDEPEVEPEQEPEVVEPEPEPEVLPRCIDPGEWDEHRLQIWMAEKEGLAETFPPNHLHPLTRFRVGDWVRVAAMDEDNANSNEFMRERQGEWLEVRDFYNNSFEPGLRLKLRDKNNEYDGWNWHWYHLDQHRPAGIVPRLSNPGLPRL